MHNNLDIGVVHILAFYSFLVTLWKGISMSIKLYIGAMEKVQHLTRPEWVGVSRGPIESLELVGLFTELVRLKST